MATASATPTPTTPVRPSGTGYQSSASCTTAVPGKYGNVPLDACNSYYNFNPEFAPAVAVAVIFGTLTIAHFVEAVLFKKRYCWVLLVGAVWETVAFALHALGAHDQQNLGLASAHAILYLLAPLWINAFAYMTAARMIWFHAPGQKVSAVPARLVSVLFVLADVLTFLVQAAGGLMASPGSDAAIVAVGLKVYMAGMGLQLLFILCFVALMVLFHRKMLELERGGGLAPEAWELGGEQPVAAAAAAPRRRWKALLFALYGTLTAITVRIIYRVAEFAGGITPSNPVPFHEAYSYALDAFPMIVALLVLAIWHPGRTLVGPESEFPRATRAEKKAAKKVKREAKEEEKQLQKDEKAMRKAEKKDVKKGGAGWIRHGG